MGYLRLVDSRLVENFEARKGDMDDLYISEALKDLGDNYLRIQDETLTGIESYVDIATKANLDRLVKIGENLLKKQVSRVNLDTGLSEPIENGGTNADVLKRFAVLLSDERKLRQLISPA